MASEANNPALRSWIEVETNSHFPIQNLPFGICRSPAGGDLHVCSAIGEFVIDLAALDEVGAFDDTPVAGTEVFHEPTLNAFMALGREAWSATRQALSQLLRDDCDELRDNTELCGRALQPANEIELQLPVDVGDYTDFYSSREHATNVGTLFRGADNALLPNWLHLPVGYHGRSSSIVVSGAPVRRPQGQTRPDDKQPPVFGTSNMVDFELEMGFFVGPGNVLGKPVPVGEAEEHIFGMVLVNDWSARDIQKWEYQPLGPFLAKNFATTVSPWVVTLDALEPFRCRGPEQEPRPLAYLQCNDGAFDIALEVWLTPDGATATRICESNFRYLYWSMAQQLAHHTVGGCNLRTGDLLASGTISGQTNGSRGSLLELAWRGEEPLSLDSGEQRSSVQDGDTVTLTGWCQGDGYRIGFGECSGQLLTAH
ncbi:MAG: fumarylacetoacetase [Candidatus Poseidoniia archaeon]|jgi:fumarylacetoacetase|nr:fumarylacetoacetase [Euryarchaeota archaeon]MDP6533683.1 fumarylacetoacetase [Candidatus Poseidoniia archaeon]HIH78967.1 fumarylacetoacetase [Candidatus Poseidoniia archaeon]|tara:strand:+ start:308 stop:1585 length:1278 start_codon:yes stop_codon:yes gene_type:complete